MNCTDFERQIVLLASDRLIDTSFREESLTHVRLCGRCRNRLTEEQNLIAGIRAVRADLATETTPIRVELRLLAAIRTQASNATVNVGKPTLTVWQWGALAAVGLILVSTVAFFWSHSAPAQRRTSITPVVAPEVSVPQQQSVDVGPERERPLVARKKQPRMRRSIRTAPNDGEVVTEFFPLLAGDDLSALESVRLVTVELPGSALAEVGLPRPPAAETTSVKAEVLLGQDGVARAIRFVQ